MSKDQKKEVAKRQIIIETDGNSISIVKAEAAGQIELIAILESVINHLKNSQN